jgi:hypothetical protein
MARRRKRLLRASELADFRTGIDRVERRPDGTFVVDGQQLYADVPVDGDEICAATEANLRALAPANRAKMALAILGTALLSPEGKEERMRVLRPLLYSGMTFELEPPGAQVEMDFG